MYLHQQKLGAKLEAEYPTIDVWHIQRELRSRAWSDQQKGCLLNFATMGVWTKDRTAKAGYLVLEGTLCQL